MTSETVANSQILVGALDKVSAYRDHSYSTNALFHTMYICEGSAPDINVQRQPLLDTLNAIENPYLVTWATCNCTCLHRARQLLSKHQRPTRPLLPYDFMTRIQHRQVNNPSQHTSSRSTEPHITLPVSHLHSHSSLQLFRSLTAWHWQAQQS